MPPRSKTVSHPVLLLSQKGDIEQGQITGGANGELSLQAIQAHFKKRQVIEPVGEFPYKALNLYIFASYNGKEGTENKHQLPPPHDLSNFFGDIVLVASKDEGSFAKPVPFDPTEYETFYTKAFGGFSSDEDELEEAPEEAAEEVPDAVEADDLNEELEDEEEDSEDEGVEIEEAEAEAEPTRVKPKKKGRKPPAKTSSTSILTGTASAYPDRPILSEDEQLQEQEVTNNPPEPVGKIRNQILKGLTTLFSKTFTASNILQLEACIYNGSLKQARQYNIVRSWNYPLFVHVYQIHARHIASNFNPASYVENKELFERFQQGEITFQDIAKMDTYELFPSRWKEQFEQQQIREKRQLEGNRSMATDMFLCTRCHKRECTYYEMQTRSADEPMTIFITCLNCGKHWRQ